MILRTQYLERIRPFYDSELIKVIKKSGTNGASKIIIKPAIMNLLEVFFPFIFPSPFAQKLSLSEVNITIKFGAICKNA